MNTAEAQLTAAKEAAARLTEHHQLERMAAMVPSLEAAAAKEKTARQAEEELRAQRARSREALTAVKLKAAIFREKYQAWLTLGEALAAELSQIEGTIETAANDLLTANFEAIRAGEPEFLSTVQVNERFSHDWAQIGGNDFQLTTVEIKNAPQLARTLVQAAQLNRVYQPEMGAAQFNVYR